MFIRRNLASFQSLLENMGIGGRDQGTRLDAGETMFIAKSLEYVIAKTYDVQYAEAKARLFIPLDSSVPNGAETYSYDQWDTVGLAKLIANYADDLPNVGAFVKRFTANCKGLGTAYDYSMQDIRAAQFARSKLPEMKPLAARRAIEYSLDDIAAFGNSDAGLKGFVNHDAVPVVTAPNGSWVAGTTTPAEMLEDLNAVADAPALATKLLYLPDTLLVDTNTFSMMHTPIGADYSTTVLEVFLKTNPYIKNVEQWTALDTADDAGTGPRWVCYKRSEEVVQLVISQEFEQFPPQPKNLAFIVPCHARTGGVSIKYPLAMCYFDRDINV
jgi:hypothetical protein